MAKEDGETTIDDVNILYRYLQGQLPDGVQTYSPKLSSRKAFSVIWFLQEVTGVIPDTIERCCNCGDLYDSDSEGGYIESTGRHYCDAHYSRLRR